MAEYSSKFSRGTYLSLVLASQGSFEVVPRESCCHDSLHVMLCGIQRIERRKPSCVQCIEYSFQFNLWQYNVFDLYCINSLFNINNNLLYSLYNKKCDVCTVHIVRILLYLTFQYVIWYQLFYHNTIGFGIVTACLVTLIASTAIGYANPSTNFPTEVLGCVSFAFQDSNGFIPCPPAAQKAYYDLVMGSSPPANEYIWYVK